ncbi:MAG: HD-GYP domain-containing protein [Actinobacteria bacterium]|nr:HD-GYP domain-containing protein [Actinomycetota bacterium]
MGSPEAASIDVSSGGSARVTLTTAYVVIIVLGAVAMLLGLFWSRGEWGHAFSFSAGTWGVVAAGLVFVAAGVFADHFRVRLGKGIEVSASFLPDFLAVTILGPLAGAVVSGVAVVSYWQKGQLLRNLTIVGVFVLSGGTCGLIYFLLGSQFVPPGEAISGLGLAVGGIVAGIAYQLVNFMLFVPIAWLRRSLRPVAYFKEALQPFLLFHIFFLILSLGLVYSFQYSGPFGFALFFLPVFGLIYAFRVYSREMELAKRLERFSLQMAASMITALDLKDNYTAQHSASVAQYSFDIACELSLSKRQCNLAHLAGLLHDLGKISVPDEVLGSTERLTSEQWEVIKYHSVAGYRVLCDMTEFEELSKVVLHHHERFDGTGYPEELSGEEIPLLSRVVSVADSYSAMVSDRPYHAKKTPEEAVAELERQMGRQFDPDVANAFIRVLSRAGREYRTSEDANFQLQFQKIRFLRDIS